jgi:hypothetical protein
LKQLMRSLCLVAGVLALAGMTAQDAYAQPPAPTWQQLSATRIRVDWTAVPGATYEVFVTNLGVGPIPVPTPYFVVDPPPGVYVIQVRVAGTSLMSSPLTINFTGAPPPGCSAPAAPELTVNVSGTAVTASWTSVAGAIGYELQVSNVPGGAPLARVQLPAAQTSFSTSGPIGTYYGRILAGSACGAASASSEKTFTLGAATPGPGPTPGPTPGAELPFPIPAACAAGDGYGCASAIAPISSEWGLCRSGNGVGCQRFTRQVVYALSRTDPNWKMIRAAPGGHACSCSSCGPSDGTMFREDTAVYGGNQVFDMIVGAGGPSPSLYWNPVPGPRAGDIPADAPVCR